MVHEDLVSTEASTDGVRDSDARLSRFPSLMDNFRSYKVEMD
jgi:hypothetical protein